MNFVWIVLKVTLNVPLYKIISIYDYHAISFTVGTKNVNHFSWYHPCVRWKNINEICNIFAFSYVNLWWWVVPYLALHSTTYGFILENNVLAIYYVYIEYKMYRVANLKYIFGCPYLINLPFIVFIFFTSSILGTILFEARCKQRSCDKGMIE